MSTSGRLSGRADDLGANHLAHLPDERINGADGGGLLAISKRLRVGRRSLAEVKGSLSDRDWAILHSLDQLHLLSTRQVERLHRPRTSYTPLAAARTARRDLTRLHDLGLVERLDRRIGGQRMGSAAFIYRLSPAGARLLQHPTRRRSHEPGLAHVSHALAVSELVVRLHEVGREGAVELLIIETEPDCWRAIVAPHGGQVLLKPDLWVVIGTDTSELHWFIEQDNSTEHRPVLARKCQTYLQAWRDGRLSQELGVFPRVLWVVPDERRRDFVQSVVDQLEAPTGMFVVTTTDRAIEVLTSGGQA